MAFVTTFTEGETAFIQLSRGKVNALNDEVVEALHQEFEAAKTDSEIRAVVLTGTGPFFSFGFDIPQFLDYSKEAFANYLEQFTALYSQVFTFPKPVVAALNGHTVAGGCMLALACDIRIMAGGNAKISLNEIGFGASVFAGSVEMLRLCVGNKTAQEILYSGKLYTGQEAHAIGLVDRLSTTEHLADDACSAAQELAEKQQPAFAAIKMLLRGPASATMKAREAASIAAFVDIWYAPETWENVEKITIQQ